MLSVAIALDPPAESAPEAVRMVAKSCEEAIGDGRCRAASELKPSAAVAWYAVIRPEEPDLSRLRVEFRDRSHEGALIEARTLTFSERDSVKSRWASTGAVIAAFVAARDPTGGAPPPPARRSASDAGRISKPVLPLPQRSRVALWDLDLALLTGPGLDTGPYRLGALARGYVAVSQAPRVLGLASFRYAEIPGELALSWWSASCGMGVRLGRRSPRVSAELTGELAFERMTMSAENQVTSQVDSAAQNRFGGRLSINVAWSAWPSLGFVAGVEATAMRPSLSIAVAGESAGREPAVGFGLSLGLRFSR